MTGIYFTRDMQVLVSPYDRDDGFPNRPHPEQPCDNLPPVLQILVGKKEGVDLV